MSLLSCDFAHPIHFRPCRFGTRLTNVTIVEVVIEEKFKDFNCFITFVHSLRILELFLIRGVYFSNLCQFSFIY